MDSKDLAVEAPRSPYETLHGFAILPRTIDKCRADISGTIGEYHFNCPVDRMLFGFKNINSDEFKSFVKTGADDESIGKWVFDHGDPKTPEEIDAWSHAFKSDFSYSTDPLKSEWFRGECLRLGLDADKTTLFDYLVEDDRVSFGKE